MLGLCPCGEQETTFLRKILCLDVLNPDHMSLNMSIIAQKSIESLKDFSEGWSHAPVGTQ